VKEQYQRQDQELSQKILDKVNDFIKRYGKDHGYTFIMAATQYGNIVYAEDYVDITDEVLVGLNAEYGGR
jgi:outer membrane protein